MDPIRLAVLAEPGSLLSWHSIPYLQVLRLEACATVLGLFHEFWEFKLRLSCLYDRHLIDQVIPQAPDQVLWVRKSQTKGESGCNGHSVHCFPLAVSLLFS